MNRAKLEKALNVTDRLSKPARGIFFVSLLASLLIRNPAVSNPLATVGIMPFFALENTRSLINAMLAENMSDRVSYGMEFSGQTLLFLALASSMTPIDSRISLLGIGAYMGVRISGILMKPRHLEKLGNAIGGLVNNARTDLEIAREYFKPTKLR